MARYEKPDKQIDPADHGLPDNLPNQVDVRDFQILVITEAERERQTYEKVVESLRGQVKRDWFVQHAYHCLPLTMANQMGFVVRALYSFEVQWSGGEGSDDVSVRPLLDAEEEQQHVTEQQIISSHFGMGTVTIQNRWHYRTAPGVNLMTVAPPNHFIDGISHMNGVIETDNLRRDFTFNLKITRSGVPIRIEKGTPIGCILPYPRNYFDQFDMQLADERVSGERIEEERAAAHLAGRERAEIDAQFNGGIGRRYMEGKDIFGNVFEDHQKTLHPPEEAAKRYRAAGMPDSVAPGITVDADPGPLHLKGVLSPEVCRSLCESWEALKSMTSDESKRVPFFDGRVLHYMDVVRERPLAAGYMKLTIDLMCEHIKSQFGCGQIWVDDIQLVKWWEGHRMPPHADRENPDGSLHTTPWRDFACVAYLNNDYEGGAIEFPELGLTVSPQMGDVICFKGDLAHSHGVQMVLSGQRYTMPCWFTGDFSRRCRKAYPELEEQALKG